MTRTDMYAEKFLVYGGCIAAWAYLIPAGPPGWILAAVFTVPFVRLIRKQHLEWKERLIARGEWYWRI